MYFVTRSWEKGAIDTSFRSRSRSYPNILHTCSWTNNGSRNGDSLRLKSQSEGNPNKLAPHSLCVKHVPGVEHDGHFLEEPLHVGGAAGLLILHQAVPFLLPFLPHLWGLFISPLPRALPAPLSMLEALSFPKRLRSVQTPRCGDVSAFLGGGFQRLVPLTAGQLLLAHCVFIFPASEILRKGETTCLLVSGHSSDQRLAAEKALSLRIT